MLIDRPDQTLIHDGAELLLLGKRWQVVNLLSTRPGQIFARGQIIDAIYEVNDAPVYDRTVDTFIKQIRADLRRVFGSDAWLETVRGSGFRWVAQPLAAGQRAPVFVSRRSD